MCHLCPTLYLVPGFSLQRRCCQGIAGRRSCVGIRGAVDLAGGSCGGVTRSSSTARSRDSGGRTCWGLKSAHVHAPGQAGHGTCQERFLLLLVHMCCWHSLSLPDLSGGAQHKPTWQHQPARPKRQRTRYVGAGSSRVRVSGWELPRHGLTSAPGPCDTRQPCHRQAPARLQKLRYLCSQVVWKATSQRKPCVLSQKKKKKKGRRGRKEDL